MEIATEQLEKFKTIYREQFGIDLTLQDAQEKALALLMMMKATYRPINKEDRDWVHKKIITMNTYGRSKNVAD